MDRYALLCQVIKEFGVEIDLTKGIKGLGVLNGYNGPGAILLFQEDGIFLSFQTAVVKDIIILFHGYEQGCTG